MDGTRPGGSRSGGAPVPDAACEGIDQRDLPVVLAKLAAGVATPADAERLRYFFADSK